MSHNSLLSSFRLSVSVVLQGLWQKDTKSSGHWYLVFFSVDPNSKGPSFDQLIKSIRKQRAVVPL